MDKLGNIVVGVDFSACSEAALRQAARIGAWSKARVFAVHVVEPLMYDISQPVVLLPVPSSGEMITDAKKRWDAFAQDLPGREAVSLDVVVGYPTGEIVHAAKAHDADLVVVGAHSSLDADKQVGSIAAGVARNAPCSVLLARQKHRGPFTRIVAAVDFSPASLTALGHAVRIAAQDGSSVDVLHVYHDPLAKPGDAEEVARNMPDFREKYRDSVVQRVREFVKPVGHELSALKASFHAVQADKPAKGIIDHVHSSPTDLVVLGSHGHSRIREFFFGSSAERVAREARAAVLVVRA